MDITRLRERLTAIDYTTDAVLERIGQAGQEGLHRNCTIPADVGLAGAFDPLAVCARLFLLRQSVPTAAAAEAFGDSLPGLVDEGILALDREAARALVELRPYASPDDGASGWLVSDLTPGLDGVVTPTQPDYVLGASPASLTLAHMTMRTPRRPGPRSGYWLRRAELPPGPARRRRGGYRPQPPGPSAGASRCCAERR